jgi:hypothetical protein
LAFFDQLPQFIEEARADTSADDSYYLKRAIPATDRELRELQDLAAEKRRIRWRDITLICTVYLPLLILARLLRPGLWLVILALWLITLIGAHFVRPWRQRRRLLKRQSRLVADVQFKYQTMLEREMRTERRRLFDALLAVVRQRRAKLLAWKQMIAAAKVTLSNTQAAVPQSTCGERLLRDPDDYPLPVDDYDERKIEQIAAQYLDHSTRPHWQQGDPGAIVAWLRRGAEQALAGWRWAIGVASWIEPERSHALTELMADTQLQWPLASDEHALAQLDLVGLPERSELVLPQLSQPLIISTSDPARLTYVPTLHGLLLEDLAALQPLWDSLPA